MVLAEHRKGVLIKNYSTINQLLEERAHDKAHDIEDHNCQHQVEQVHSMTKEASPLEKEPQDSFEEKEKRKKKKEKRKNNGHFDYFFFENGFLFRHSPSLMPKIRPDRIQAIPTRDTAVACRARKRKEKRKEKRKTSRYVCSQVKLGGPHEIGVFSSPSDVISHEAEIGCSRGGGGGGVEVHRQVRKGHGGQHGPGEELDGQATLAGTRLEGLGGCHES